MDDWWLFFAVGFVAQLVDGALGMAYGVLTNTVLLAIGLPPAQASALVHTAEIFTTGASAASHIYHRNVDWRMVARLGVTGVLGAILGAWILSNIDVTAARRFVYGYLLIMGLYILWKSMRIALVPRKLAGWTAPLGFVAGFLDASGGGGWGPMTTSTLVGSGHAPRRAVGQDLHPPRQASPARGGDRARLSGLSLPARVRGGLRDGPRPPLSRASLHRRDRKPDQKPMTTLTLIAALVGVLIPPIVIVQALRSKAKDRWPEGLLVGVYLGALGAISVTAIITYFR